MWNREQPAREQVNDHVVTALQHFDMSREWMLSKACACVYAADSQTQSAACTACLWSAHSYENIRPMHTLLWWFTADTSGGEDIRETVGTEGIGLGPSDINIPFKMPHTFMHGTHSQRHTLKSWCWHGACTWPSFIAPVCPLWLSVLCVCGGFVWTAGAEDSRLQSPVI